MALSFPGVITISWLPTSAKSSRLNSLSRVSKTTALSLPGITALTAGMHPQFPLLASDVSQIFASERAFAALKMTAPLLRGATTLAGIHRSPPLLRRAVLADAFHDDRLVADSLTPPLMRHLRQLPAEQRQQRSMRTVVVWPGCLTAAADDSNVSFGLLQGNGLKVNFMRVRISIPSGRLIMSRPSTSMTSRIREVTEIHSQFVLLVRSKPMPREAIPGK